MVQQLGMITDTIENAASYANLGARISTALGFLSRPDLITFPVGRHAVEGDEIFAMVQEYHTRRPDETFWETHRKYVDVQCVQLGEEVIAWSPIQKMKLKKEYDPEKEIIVWEGSGQRIVVPAGNFMILMPHDAHMGGLLIDQPRAVRKIVVKVAVG